jgi:hypothetical protein
MPPIWITWENQRRNRELSLALGCKLYELSEIASITNYVSKCLSGISKTFLILYREKPKLVFCQNPSIVLASFLILVKFVTGIRVCVDAHNAGLFPKEGKSRFLNAIAQFIQRRADLTLVTNESLKQHVEKNGGRAFALPDKIPTIACKESKKLKGKINILFICTYASDEPYQLFFDAARLIDQEICIYVTGNFRKHSIEANTLSGNIILMGYIPEETYQEMLHSVDITIDLTSREDCLVCGAYESVAVGKPMILSNTKTLRAYFNKGAVYADHTVESLLSAVNEVVKRREYLANEIIELREIRIAEWQERKNKLDILLAELVQ